MFQEEGIMQWAQLRHDYLLPCVPVSPPMQLQPARCSTDKTKAIIREELNKKKTANSETKGCRKIRANEYVIYLGYAGVPADTTRSDAPEFL